MNQPQKRIDQEHRGATWARAGQWAQRRELHAGLCTHEVFVPSWKPQFCLSLIKSFIRAQTCKVNGRWLGMIPVPC